MGTLFPPFVFEYLLPDDQLLNLSLVSNDLFKSFNLSS